MKLLIGAYSGLGNLILRIPMIQKAAAYGTVDLITGTGPMDDRTELGKLIPCVNQVHQLSVDAPLLEKIAFFRSLKGYDAIFLPFDSRPRFLTLGSYLTGIPKRVIHHTGPFPKTTYVPLPKGRHEIDLNFDLLEAYLGASIEREYKTPIPHRKIDSSPYIAIQPGARYGAPTPKTWHPDNFKKLIQKLQERYPVVIVGSENEAQEYPGTINKAGKTTLSEVANLLANAKLVITHDSGLMHLANAVNAPLIALYGPTDYERTRPLNPTSHLLFSRTSHFAAMSNFKITEEALAAKTAPYECMSGITVDDVLEKIKTVLY